MLNDNRRIEKSQQQQQELGKGRDEKKIVLCNHKKNYQLSKAKLGRQASSEIIAWNKN